MSTNIEWASNPDGTGGETWNPVSGCTRASAGCDNCYAVTMTKRLAAMGQEKYQGLVNEGKSHFNGVVKCHEDALTIPLKWKKPRTIFVNSMSDLFHRDVPFSFIGQVFDVIRTTPWHTYQVLSKRPEIMAGFTEMFYRECMAKHSDPIPNLWLGTSVENQAAADERIPHLLRCPAAVRFLSVEPMLGAVDISRWAYDRDAEIKSAMRGPMALNRDQADSVTPEVELHWVICGGESGAKARIFDLQWARDLRDQCAAAGVPFFMKQLGSNARSFANETQRQLGGVYVLEHSDGKGGDMERWEEGLRVRQMPERGKP